MKVKKISGQCLPVNNEATSGCSNFKIPIKSYSFSLEYSDI